VRDVLIVCCDGLTGLAEAIEATWPQATVQTCVVHLIRAATRFVSYKDRKAVCAGLRPVYQAANEEAAMEALDAFDSSELGQRYPGGRSRPSPTPGTGSCPSCPSRRCCAGSSTPPTASSH